MAFTLVQAGASLYTLNSRGGVSPTALTLPSGVALDVARVPRFAKFNRYIVMVNTPTVPITIDPNGTVRPLTPKPPSAALTLTGAAGGTLSGTYLGIYAYVILDTQGNLVAHSDYSPLMTGAVTVASKNLLAAGLLPPSELFTVQQAAPASGSALALPALRLYRTVTNGTEYFKWLDVSPPVIAADGSALVALSDLPDDALGTVSAPIAGTAPDLTIIKEWQGRLWGVDRTDVDILRYTESGLMWAWSALNALPIRAGQDAAGITALIPRRNALGVARRDVIVQVTGVSTFNVATIPGGEGRGCVSQESVVVDEDDAYFLWQDGVYKWDAQGVSSIVNGRISAWFDTDDVFNRAMFPKAQAQLVNRRYRLFLAASGSTRLDRWIEYDLDSQTWWGPHRTDACTPACTIVVPGGDNQDYPMIGTRDGFVVQEQDDANDFSAFGIPVQVDTKQHGDPEREQYFGELSVWGASATGSLTITPTVGTLDGTGAVEQDPFTYDMAQGRQKLGRIGSGRHASLVFTHDTINEPVTIYGYTIDPVVISGRR